MADVDERKAGTWLCGEESWMKKNDSRGGNRLKRMRNQSRGGEDVDEKGSPLIKRFMTSKRCSHSCTKRHHLQLS